MHTLGEYPSKDSSLACSLYSAIMPYPEDTCFADIGSLIDSQSSSTLPVDMNVATSGTRLRNLREVDFLNECGTNPEENIALQEDLSDFCITYQTMSQLEWHDVAVPDLNDMAESVDLRSESDSGFAYGEHSPSSAEDLTDDVSDDSSDFGSDGCGGSKFLLDRKFKFNFPDDQSDSDPHLDQCQPMHTVLDSSSRLHCPSQKKKPGRKKGQTSNVLHLWEFIRDLLVDPETCGSLIRWENRTEGVFRLVNSNDVAMLWGQKKKNKKPMTYEKMSRSLRYSRKEGYFVDLPKHSGYPKKLCFRFGPKSHGWK
ncbi:ETS-related transcription factor Elf-3-like isoform X2 [Gigantopelta aegis]|uniref:ETS-related transcription factor Elf-3-like isoform X2 n=1 Tax=Gigantopelta aegis TaxID=1735272 RepID=UPI001B88B7EC|nr:ETS-related transcription factor Elf-3-like isoform X2 [Gigantopelta aegis]